MFVQSAVSHRPSCLSVGTQRRCWDDVGVCRKYISSFQSKVFQPIREDFTVSYISVCVCEDDVAKPTDPHLFPVSPLQLSSRN